MLKKTQVDDLVKIKKQNIFDETDKNTIKAQKFKSMGYNENHNSIMPFMT